MKTRFPFTIPVPGSLALAVVLTASSVLAQPATAPGASDENRATVPELGAATVRVDGHPLFRVRGTSSITAEDRARGIGGLISAAAADRDVSPDSLFISET